MTKWILSKEQMPESGQQVLAVIQEQWNGEPEGEAYVTLARWDGVELWFVEDRVPFKTEEVTHWMPLPDLPNDLEE